MGITDLVNALSQALEKVVAPGLNEIRGELKAVNSRMDGLGDRLTSEIARLEEKIGAQSATLNARIDVLSERMDKLSEHVDNGFSMLRLILENATLRGDKQAIQEMADLRDRVTRLEAQQRQLPQ